MIPSKHPHTPLTEQYLQTIAWLDPGLLYGPVLDAEETPPSLTGIHRIRAVFEYFHSWPKLIEIISNGIHRGRSTQALHQYLQHIFDQYPDIHWNQWLMSPYLIPIGPRGINWMDSEAYLDHHVTDYMDALLTGIAAPGWCQIGSIEYDDLIYALQMGRRLAHLLEDFEEPFCRLLHDLLIWLVADSENPIIALTTEDTYATDELEYDYTPENLEIVNEMQREADAILLNGYHATLLMNQYPKLFKAYRRVCRATNRAIEQGYAPEYSTYVEDALNHLNHIAAPILEREAIP